MGSPRAVPVPWPQCWVIPTWDPLVISQFANWKVIGFIQQKYPQLDHVHPFPRCEKSHILVILVSSPTDWWTPKNRQIKALWPPEAGTFQSIQCTGRHMRLPQSHHQQLFLAGSLVSELSQPGPCWATVLIPYMVDTQNPTNHQKSWSGVRSTN